MRPSVLPFLLVGLSACTVRDPAPESQTTNDGTQLQNEATTPETTAPETTTPETTTPPPTEPPKTAPTEIPPTPPEETIAQAKLTPQQRWVKGIRWPLGSSKPPADSVIGRLPAAEAVALVHGEQVLELVAVGPSGWRLELARGAIHSPSFERGTGLVLFYREGSIWALDLLEPLATPDAKPQAVELGRIPDDIPGDPDTTVPSQISVCVPDDSGPPGFTCWPSEPLPDDVEYLPEYLSVHLEEKPGVIWHVVVTTVEDGEEDESLEQIQINLLAAEWLRARGVRHKDFAPGGGHWLLNAEPLAGIPDLSKHCWDEDCGTSLPLGVSGWEWVLAGSSRGDLYHPEFVVYDPSKQVWASWKSLIEGAPKWIATNELEPVVDDMSEEEYVLFDVGGRVFAGPYAKDQFLVCRFVFDGDPPQTTGVSCEPTGGQVVAFVSGSVTLGEF